MPDNQRSTEKGYGLMQPQTVPSRSWKHVITDFVTESPVTKSG